MRAIETVEPEFVEVIPEHLVPGKLYISIAYGTVVHLCCCGCGNETVTTLHPTRWKLTYDGEAVSLSPSVGSWNMPCQSHYIITRNRVRWAAHMSKAKIETARRQDAEAAKRYVAEEEEIEVRQATAQHGQSTLARLCRRLRESWGREKQSSDADSCERSRTVTYRGSRG